MIGKRTQLFSIVTIGRARLLAALILLSIGWGATAEFTHSHTRRVSKSVTQNQVSIPAPVNAVEQSKSTNGYARQKNAANCLICQLHQNLSNIEIDQVSVVAATDNISGGAETATLFHHGDFSTNRRGRAPPAISLS